MEKRILYLRPWSPPVMFLFSYEKLPPPRRSYIACVCVLAIKAVTILNFGELEIEIAEAFFCSPPSVLRASHYSASSSS